MQYLGYVYTLKKKKKRKKTVSYLSEIQNYLGSVYFYFLNLATLNNGPLATYECKGLH